ncbi:hypothetical protein CGCS363_v012652 [Colletotrichum siamense]|uniref:uncharacterized protein n=1 Tax=Colletotrichum siamense TaxID=690259 RepID=UPI0018727DA8|nr:uncharacterized protein CGCS363_v012652 [Colletotrichum siamense]KAF5489484.1 hypothetical protein CGCS363_v012652 [Colletotrichum siamense]
MAETAPSSHEVPKLPSGLKSPVHPEKGWNRLGKGTWFHGRPETDVYKLLIDAYRLRMDDRWDVAKVKEPGSLYAPGATDGKEGFRIFLDKAEKTKSDEGKPMLPTWWNAEKRKECEALGADTTQWTSLAKKVKKWDIHIHYDDMALAMQLRCVGEKVYNLLADGRRIAKIPDDLFEGGLDNEFDEFDSDSDEWYTDSD